jgi:hypothetical protein
VKVKGRKDAPERWDVSRPFFFWGVIVAAFFSAATRLPAIWQDQSPYMFCDEELFFYADVLRMLRTESLFSSVFYSGPMNVYPIWIVTRFIELFVPLSDTQVLLVGRLILPFGLGTLSVIPLALFIRNLTGLRYVGLIGLALYVFSSFLSAVSRYWYPDHFIFFFAALVAMYSARLVIVDRPYLTSFFLGVSSAMVFSVKYHSAVLGIMILFAFVMRHKRLGSDHQSTRESLRALLTFFSTAVGFTLLFHLNSIVHFDQLFGQQAANLANYNHAEADLVEGLAAHGFLAFVITAGPLGLVLALSAALHFIATRQLLLLGFLLSPVLALILVFGSQGLFVSRNIVPISPLLIATFAIGAQFTFHKFSEKYSGLAVLLRILVGLLASIQVVLAAYAFVQDLRPDSRTLAQSWIQRNVPVTAVIGTNESCFGQSPAMVAGSRTIFDPQMHQGLDFYVFESYGPSAISSLFRGDNAGMALLEPKYLHFYHFGNREFYKSLPSAIERQSVVTIDGYEIVEKFQENGPEVWVWKKSD